MSETVYGEPMPPTLDALSDREFRQLARQWLDDHVVGDYAAWRGRGGPGDEDVGFDVRVESERELGLSGWIGIGWPRSHGGRGASIAQQVIWAEEYTRAQAPARVNHMGENLLARTLIEFGTAAQCARFLPGILDGTQRWCQGYSEPDAGSDLANVKTSAVLDGVRQITGGGEFNEVFFSDARTSRDMVVGEPSDGWRVAMALLGFERAISTLAQQIGFERELHAAIGIARRRGGPTLGSSASDWRKLTPGCRSCVGTHCARWVPVCRVPSRASASCPGARGIATSAR